MTRASLRSLLNRAAGLLEREAKLLREGCTNQDSGALWSCEDCRCSARACDARRTFERHRAVARELRLAASKGISR